MMKSAAEQKEKEGKKTISRSKTVIRFLNFFVFLLNVF